MTPRPNWTFGSGTLKVLQDNGIERLFKGKDPLTDQERFGKQASSQHSVAWDSRVRDNEVITKVAFVYLVESAASEQVLVCRASRTRRITVETAKVLRDLKHVVESVRSRSRIIICTITTEPRDNVDCIPPRCFVAAVATTADKFTLKVFWHAAFKKAMGKAAKEFSYDGEAVFDRHVRQTLVETQSRA